MTAQTQAHVTLVTLTSDLVAAHLSNNPVKIEQVPSLIRSVFTALSNLGAKNASAESTRQPAVTVRASVRPDHVVCLECGKKLKTLKRHLGAEHGLSADAYRKRCGLPADHLLVAPDYTAARSALSKTLGLGRKPKAQAKVQVLADGTAPGEAGTKPDSKQAGKLSLRFKDAAA